MAAKPTSPATSPRRSLSLNSKQSMTIGRERPSPSGKKYTCSIRRSPGPSRARRPNVGPSARFSMKRGQPLGQLGEVLPAELAARQQRSGAGVIGQPAHVNGPVDDVAAPLALPGTDGEPARRPADRLDAQVDVRREPPIESNLLLAEQTAG